MWLRVFLIVWFVFFRSVLFFCNKGCDWRCFGVGVLVNIGVDILLYIIFSGFIIIDGIVVMIVIGLVCFIGDGWLRFFFGDGDVVCEVKDVLEWEIFVVWFGDLFWIFFVFLVVYLVDCLVIEVFVGIFWLLLFIIFDGLFVSCKCLMEVVLCWIFLLVVFV